MSQVLVTRVLRTCLLQDDRGRFFWREPLQRFQFNSDADILRLNTWISSWRDPEFSWDIPRVHRCARIIADLPEGV